MRLFIAMDCNKIEEVENIQKSFSMDGILDVKTFHITLKFLGDCDKVLTQKVIEKLDAINFEKINTTIDHVGAFPVLSKPKVIWIGMNPTEKIVKLQKKIDESLETLFTKEPNFYPHITISRVKVIKNINKLIQKIVTQKVNRTKILFNEFVLYASELTRKGPIYSKVKSFG